MISIKAHALLYFITYYIHIFLVSDANENITYVSDNPERGVRAYNESTSEISDYSHDGSISSKEDLSKECPILQADDLVSHIERHNVSNTFIDDLLRICFRTILIFLEAAVPCCNQLCYNCKYYQNNYFACNLVFLFNYFTFIGHFSAFNVIPNT